MKILIDKKALDLAFTGLRFTEDGTLRHWDDRQNWCMSGQEVEDLINSVPTIDIPTGVAVVVSEDGTVSRITGVKIVEGSEE